MKDPLKHTRRRVYALLAVALLLSMAVVVAPAVQALSPRKGVVMQAQGPNTFALLTALQLDRGVRYSLALSKDQEAVLPDLKVLAILPPGVEVLEALETNGYTHFLGQFSGGQGEGDTLIWTAEQLAANEFIDAFSFTLKAMPAKLFQVRLSWGGPQAGEIVLNSPRTAAHAEALSGQIKVDRKAASQGLLRVGNTGVQVDAITGGLKDGSVIRVQHLGDKDDPPAAANPDVWWCASIDLAGGEPAGVPVLVPLRKPLPPGAPVALFGRSADGQWTQLAEQGAVFFDGQHVAFIHRGGIVAAGVKKPFQPASAPTNPKGGQKGAQQQPAQPPPNGQKQSGQSKPPRPEQPKAPPSGPIKTKVNEQVKQPPAGNPVTRTQPIIVTVVDSKGQTQVAAQKTQGASVQQTFSAASTAKAGTGGGQPSPTQPIVVAPKTFTPTSPGAPAATITPPIVPTASDQKGDDIVHAQETKLASIQQTLAAGGSGGAQPTGTQAILVNPQTFTPTIVPTTSDQKGDDIVHAQETKLASIQQTLAAGGSGGAQPTGTQAILVNPQTFTPTSPGAPAATFTQTIVPTASDQKGDDIVHAQQTKLASAQQTLAAGGSGGAQPAGTQSIVTNPQTFTPSPTGGSDNKGAADVAEKLTQIAVIQATLTALANNSGSQATATPVPGNAGVQPSLTLPPTSSKADNGPATAPPKAGGPGANVPKCADSAGILANGGICGSADGTVAVRCPFGTNAAQECLVAVQQDDGTSKLCLSAAASQELQCLPFKVPDGFAIALLNAIGGESTSVGTKP